MVKPLVEEKLTTAQVKELLAMADIRSSKWELNDHLSIHKGWFKTWDGETHDGCIVAHHKDKEIEYYFMEVELEKVHRSEYGHTYKAEYHMLMPISEPKATQKFYSGTTAELCQHIISNATHDNWDYYKVPMTAEEIAKAKKEYSFAHIMRDYTKLDPLTYSDLNHWFKPLTEAEKQEVARQKAKREKELISIFANENLPCAEDDIWYEILSFGYGTKGYDLECKIIKILRNRGYNVHIDGERDSFGWVTRGIFVDGEMMCIY